MIRSLALPALAAGAAALAFPAAAEEWLVSPELTEASRAAAPQVGLSVESGLDDSPFYSDFTYRGLALEAYPDVDWHLQEGADSPYDVDPRENLYLPRPAPGLVFDLR